MVLVGLLVAAVMLTYQGVGQTDPRRRRAMTDEQARGYRAAFGECPSTMTLREETPEH